jgi:hypothetical protein
MLQNVTLTPSRSRALEFGIYRDGDNNLDASQSNVLAQAQDVSAADSSIQFTVEDTGKHGTERYTIQDGLRQPQAETRGNKMDDMADPKNLAQLVKRTLDNAEACGAKQTWIDLVDHGAGDGGGLEADTFKSVMPMPQIAAAIAEGVKLHAQEHPEDANRGVDGVVANQCLMSSMGFADALSRAGVKYLAASPETMISPGVPSSVAHDIARHLDDSQSMAASVVKDVMNARDPISGCGPAAAFDVLDLDRGKIAAAERAIKAFNDDAAGEAAGSAAVRDALRSDIASVDGMVRFPEATRDMPWHADRPAIALYDTVASDASLDTTLRGDASQAADAVKSLVLAHKESGRFEPFGGSSYRDAVGPTVHVPVTPKQIDPWAPNVSETHNSFYRDTDAAKFVRAVA